MAYHLQDSRFTTEDLTLYSGSGGMTRTVVEVHNRMATPTQSVSLTPLFTRTAQQTAVAPTGQQGTPLVVHTTLPIPTPPHPVPLSTLQTVPQDTSGVHSSIPPVRKKPQILENMKLLRDAGKYCDVVIDVKGRRFRVHKNVLAAWSPYFDCHLFGDGYTSADLMIVNYDNFDVFSDLLDFLYSGCIAPRETNFLQLLHLAVSFQIDPLRGDCEEYLRSNLHLGNFISTYFLCRKYSLTSLEDFIAGFLQMNLADAVKQNEFLSLAVGRIHAFLSTGRMKQVKPEVKLFLIISWVGFDVLDRERYLVMLLKHIDWSTVASDFLLEISRTENFFTTHESSLYLLLQTLYSSQISLGPYVEHFPALRQTYSHILNDIVQIGLVTPEMETFCPVTVSVSSIMSSNIKRDAAVNTDVTGPDVETAMPQSGRPSITRNVELGDGRVGGDQEESMEHVDDADSNFQDVSCTYLDIHTGNMKTHRRKGMPKKIKLILPIPPESRQRSPRQSSPNKKTSAGVTTRRSRRSKVAEPEVEEENDEEEMEEHEADDKSENDKEEMLRNVELGNNAEDGNEDDEDEEDDDEEEDDDDDDNEDDDDDDDNEDEEEEEDSDQGDSQATDSTANEQNKSSRPLRNRKRKKTYFGYSGDEKTILRECAICGFTCTSVGIMREHKVTHHFKAVTFTCQECNFSAKTNREYLAHMRKHYNDGPPFHCREHDCEFTTSRLNGMAIHRRTHTKERPFECQICSLKFKSINNLFAHLRTHTENRPFECNICQMRFRTKHTRDTHLVTHSNERPFLCDTCGFSTKFQSHLISHKRIHTGDVYECTFPGCTYFTPKRSQLKYHMRRHSEVRECVCTVCDKSFKEKSHLNRHMKVHGDRDVYECQECCYSSYRSDKLKDHFKRHHGENPTAKKQYKKRKRQESTSVPKSNRQEFDHAYTMPLPTTSLPTTYIHDLHGNVQSIPGLLPINHLNIATMTLPITLAQALEEEGVAIDERLATVTTSDGDTLVSGHNTITTHRLVVHDVDHRIVMSESEQRLLLQESDHQSYIQSLPQGGVGQTIITQLPQGGVGQTILSLGPHNGISHALVSSEPQGGVSHTLVSSASQGGVSHAIVPSAPQGGVSHAFVSSAPQGGVSHAIMSSAPQGGVSHTLVSSAPQGGISHAIVSSAPQGGLSHAIVSSAPQVGVNQAIVSPGQSLQPVQDYGGLNAFMSLF